MEPLQPDVEDWIGQWPKEQQDQFKWLAERVLAADGGITWAIKWRRLTFTANGIGIIGSAPPRSPSVG